MTAVNLSLLIEYFTSLDEITHSKSKMDREIILPSTIKKIFLKKLHNELHLVTYKFSSKSDVFANCFASFTYIIEQFTLIVT